LAWFLDVLLLAVNNAQSTLDTVLRKALFWQRWAGTSMNARQIKLLNRLLDGFEGKLTTGKWAAIAKCSPDTALRDITELMSLGVLKRSPGGGRSTGYEVAE
jgi:Fic family protein